MGWREGGREGGRVSERVNTPTNQLYTPRMLISFHAARYISIVYLQQNIVIHYTKRYHRKPYLIICGVGAAVCYVLLATVVKTAVAAFIVTFVRAIFNAFAELMVRRPYSRQKHVTQP